MWTKTRALLALAAAGLSAAPLAEARITRIEITTTESPTFGGFSWPGVGQYEKLIGKAFGEVDPHNRQNRDIVDIEFAPRNARGKVEYAFNFYILKPIDLKKGADKMMYEPPNRGGKTWAALGRVTGGGDDPGSITEPTVLANAFRRFGQPIDPRFNTITVEQLLMHRAGLAREAAPGPPAQDMAGTFVKTLATPLEGAPGGTMSYSNIGYLTLGMIAETVAGIGYEKYCHDASLAPMKASGSIDPMLRARAPNGGWRVSAVDYAKFLQVFDPATAGLGPISRTWLESRNERPAYGLGVQMRRTARGFILSHSGRVALRERGGAYSISSTTAGLWSSLLQARLAKAA
jgi:hypothetical protein